MIFGALFIFGLNTNIQWAYGENPTYAYTITYDENGADSGNVPTDNTAYSVGDNVPLAENTGALQKSEYKFLGWGKTADATTPLTSYSVLSSDATDYVITLYALWQKIIKTEPSKANNYKVEVSEGISGETYQWYKLTKTALSLSTGIAEDGTNSGDWDYAFYNVGSYDATKDELTFTPSGTSSSVFLVFDNAFAGATQLRFKYSGTATLNDGTNQLVKIGDYYYADTLVFGQLYCGITANTVEEVVITDVCVIFETSTPLTTEKANQLSTAFVPEITPYYCVVTLGNARATSEKIDATYTATFEGNDGATGTPPDTVYQLDGRKITLPKNTFTKTNYKFLGWNTTKTATKGLDTLEMGNSNITLYAVWEKKTAVTLTETPQTYTFGDSDIGFGIKGTTLSDFEIEYFVGSWTKTAPANVGTYNVKITRAEDDTYGDFSKEITGGLVIGKATAAITVDQTPIVKTYGEEITIPTATTTFGEVSCDKVATDLVNAGSYTITYTVIGTDNYNGDTKTVSVTINKLPVSQPVAVGTYKYTGEPQTVVLEGVEDYMTRVDPADETMITQTAPGEYLILFVLDDNHCWAEGSNGNVIWEIRAISITPKQDTSLGEEQQKQEIIVETEEGFESDIEVVVEITLATQIAEAIEKQKLSLDYYNIGNEKAKLADGEKVGVIFDVKLVKIEGDNRREIQPSDIKDGTTIKVKMLIPDSVNVANITRILHVHNENDIEVIDFDASKIDGDGYYEIEVTQLSEFAFICTITDNCIIHWFLLALFIALFVFVAVLWFAFKIKNFHQNGKIQFAPIIGFGIDLVAIIVFAIVAKCVLCILFYIVNGLALTVFVLLYLLHKEPKENSDLLQRQPLPTDQQADQQTDQQNN